MLGSYVGSHTSSLPLPLTAASLIQLAEKLEERDKKRMENIYEEIAPKERRIRRSKSFLSPLQGREEQRWSGMHMERPKVDMML